MLTAQRHSTKTAADDDISSTAALATCRKERNFDSTNGCWLDTVPPRKYYPSQLEAQSEGKLIFHDDATYAKALQPITTLAVTTLADWEHLHSDDAELCSFVTEATQIAVQQHLNPSDVPSASHQLLQAAVCVATTMGSL
jgi:hypothetical protein